MNVATHNYLEMRMFSHMTLGSNDLERSKKFYDALFEAMGGAPGDLRSDVGRVYYFHGGAMFILMKPINGLPATYGNGETIGFPMTPEQAEAWHAAGVANGGRSCEDPPGIRETANGPVYLAYLRDPDGHKLCAIHRYNQG